MKKIALAVVVGLVLAVGWTFVKRPLPVPSEPLGALPDAPSVAGVTMSLIPGAMMKSQHGFSVRGGDLTEEYRSGLVAFLVEHPKGRLMIDAGISRDVEAHVKTMPWLMQTLASTSELRPTADHLAANGIKPSDLIGILLTHGHWDHVSGLAELSEVPVWITKEELAFMRSDDAGRLLQELEKKHTFRFNDLRLTGGAYGPFPTSYDFFGDGTVVVVPMPGHTPGSVAVFVNLPSGRRFLFVGDTAWTREGVDWPAEKPWLARRLVDVDAAGVRDQLVLLHRIQREHPKLTIVPAHDARVHETIAMLPAREQ